MLATLLGIVQAGLQGPRLGLRTRALQSGRCLGSEAAASPASVGS